MVEIPTPVPQPAPQGIRARDPQYRELYSNASQTQIGPFDLTILFQKNSEIFPGAMGQTDLVSVTLSPQHFKGLVRSLNETLSAFETLFGALTISDADTAPLKNATEIVELVKSMKEKAIANPSLSAPQQPSPAGTTTSTPTRVSRRMVASLISGRSTRCAQPPSRITRRLRPLCAGKTPGNLCCVRGKRPSGASRSMAATSL